MQGFLREVAEDLYSRHGSGMSSIQMLFPSRRARIFFSSELSSIIEKPIWQPEWLTIEELMCEISGLQQGERVRMITELYKIYSEYHQESFDKFYFWGDMLLADFDMIDKYLIDADMLFSNIADIKEIEADISYLTPSQLKILSFWANFEDDANLSLEKRKFLKIWKSLPKVYHRFKARLTELKIAYTGMIQRTAIENISNGVTSAKDKHYVIAGFNALSECEKRLFKHLSNVAKTEFYWDYDKYYKEKTEQEAGMFIRDNIKLFPPQKELAHDNFAKDKNITVISSLSNALQCKYASKIVSELLTKGNLDRETAIVLTDENLLIPLLYSLPEDIGRVNVTMGYPLRQSLAYSFIERLIELQNHSRKRDGGCSFYHIDVLGIVQHPYLLECDSKIVSELQSSITKNRRIYIESAMFDGGSTLLKSIFSATANWQELSRYIQQIVGEVANLPAKDDEQHQRIEFLSVLQEQLVRLDNSLKMCDLELSVDIYSSLLRKHLQTVRLPFEGEPLKGVQIMGILETRNLDFQNVILLSMNDDNFPGNHMSSPSFVPYNLRAAYGLPTPEHHEGVYAYYFYRLIQRATNIWMLYCSQADEKTTGEPSRYIHQLHYETNFNITRIEASVDVNLDEREHIFVAKDDAIMETLNRYIDAESQASLSPTSFFRYVVCPLKFYFHSIARLKNDEDMSEDVDAPMFGDILHKATQKLYNELLNQSKPYEKLKLLSAKNRVERAVVEAINENYLKDESSSMEDYTGNLLLVKSIVTKYIQNGIMKYDLNNYNFVVTGVEDEVAMAFEFQSQGEVFNMKFKGIVDRIDSLDNGVIRVVDYKTGTPKLDFMGISALFHGVAKERVSNVMQTLLYSMMLHRVHKRDVEPALYYVRSMNQDGYSSQIKDAELKRVGVHYSEYAEEFEAELRLQLGELYNQNTPFMQCEDAESCVYCDFKVICKR